MGGRMKWSLASPSLELVSTLDGLIQLKADGAALVLSCLLAARDRHCGLSQNIHHTLLSYQRLSLTNFSLHVIETPRGF